MIGGSFGISMVAGAAMLAWMAFWEALTGHYLALGEPEP